MGVGKGRPVTTEAETGGTWPPAQGPVEPQEAGGGRQDPAPEPPEGGQPCETLTSDRWPPQPREDPLPRSEPRVSGVPQWQL